MLVPASVIAIHIDCRTSILNAIEDIVSYKRGKNSHIGFYTVICLFKLH
jgi:hypothetical protein